ncbi:type II toxin-antitoxin system ParD family antitoxin [Belnapia sp. F-4-1]|uniref:type II toxin-antitoxin system ParD family antitoxin n=1 Tax=Belnapia sp. F-4-1 TaxID=1545443 RepID=UPI00350EE054
MPLSVQRKVTPSASTKRSGSGAESRRSCGCRSVAGAPGPTSGNRMPAGPGLRPWQGPRRYWPSSVWIGAAPVLGRQPERHQCDAGTRRGTRLPLNKPGHRRSHHQVLGLHTEACPPCRRRSYRRLWQRLACTLPLPKVLCMPPSATMNVSITPELAAFVQGRVATGRYRSASEVVRAALRRLVETERERDLPPVPQAKASRRGRAGGR